MNRRNRGRTVLFSPRRWLSGDDWDASMLYSRLGGYLSKSIRNVLYLENGEYNILLPSDEMRPVKSKRVGVSLANRGSGSWKGAEPLSFCPAVRFLCVLLGNLRPA